MKDSNYVKINGVNPLYLIVVEVDGCIEKKNGKKYLTLVCTNKNKEWLIKYMEVLDNI